MQILKIHFFPGPLFSDTSADVKQRFKLCCAHLTSRLFFSFMDTYQMPAKVVQQVNAVQTSTDQAVFFRFGRQSARDDLLHVEAKAFVTTGKAALDEDPESIRELSHQWGRNFLREFLPSKGYNLDVEAHIGVSTAGERCESIDVYD